MFAGITKLLLDFLRAVLLNVRVAVYCKIYSPYDCFIPVANLGILFRGGGVQQIQLRTEDRENGDLGAVAP